MAPLCTQVFWKPNLLPEAPLHPAHRQRPESLPPPRCWDTQGLDLESGQQGTWYQCNTPACHHGNSFNLITLCVVCQIFSCLMAFFLCNMMETHFLSTGAFEITLNGEFWLVQTRHYCVWLWISGKWKQQTASSSLTLVFVPSLSQMFPCGQSCSQVTSRTSRRFSRSSTTTWRWTRWIPWASPPHRAGSTQTGKHTQTLACKPTHTVKACASHLCASLSSAVAALKGSSPVGRSVVGIHEGSALKQTLPGRAGCPLPWKERSRCAGPRLNTTVLIMHQLAQLGGSADLAASTGIWCCFCRFSSFLFILSEATTVSNMLIGLFWTGSARHDAEKQVNNS